jgi:hypothetical protein
VKRYATNSPLLCLPAELRNNISKFAMCGNTVQRPDFWGYQQKGGAVHTANGRTAPDFPNRSYRDPAVVHLPEVSQQICSETAMLTYASNTFAVNHYINRNFGRSKNIWPASLLLAHQRAVGTVTLTADHIWDCMHCFSWVNRSGKDFPTLRKSLSPPRVLSASVNLNGKLKTPSKK